MVFKKYDEQQTYQVPAKNAAGIDLAVGDVFSQNPSTHEIEKVVNKADAIAAMADQKELYLVAQSDAITFKTGTEYKTYKLGTTVEAEADVETIIVAYRVTMVDNVSGWEDEQ